MWKQLISAILLTTISFGAMCGDPAWAQQARPTAYEERIVEASKYIYGHDEDAGHDVEVNLNRGIWLLVEDIDSEDVFSLFLAHEAYLRMSIEKLSYKEKMDTCMLALVFGNKVMYHKEAESFYKASGVKKASMIRRHNLIATFVSKNTPNLKIQLMKELDGEE